MERFLLPTPDYPPKRGGVARYCSALVLTFPNAITPMIWKAFPSYKEMFMEFWRRRREFDVLLTSHVLPIGTTALIFRCVTRKPYEIILHGLDFDAARSVPRKRFMMWLVLFFARRVFANSKALADEVAAFAHRSCLVMYPCVADELIESADIVNTSSERLQSASLRLLTVGRLVERKGHLKVLEAMKQIPNATYTIVGDGPMKKEILEAIGSMELQDRVTVLPHVSDGKLPDVYASHDIFVMPSTKSKSDREGFGIVAIEASLFGLPVLATNQPGVDEAVIDGETGILIEDTTGDLVTTIKKLGSDPALRDQLGRFGRERVMKKFTREKTMSVFGHSDSVPTPYPLHPTPFPLVSIYIATYQHARTLGKCIESILAQTYRPIEVIVVDDGSTDNTAEVLQKFDKKIRVIYQENAGANPARNRGFTETAGEFTICSDADVIMKPRMVEEYVRQLQRHPEASYAYGGFKFGWKVFRDVPFSAERLRKMNFVHTTTLVRRKDFPGFDPAIKRFQDWDVWLTMLEQGKIGVLVPGVWCDVLIDGESRIGSSWLPSFVYQLPWKRLGWMPKRVQKYHDARIAIAKKHQL